jgi:hypothetical protein
MGARCPLFIARCSAGVAIGLVIASGDPLTSYKTDKETLFSLSVAVETGIGSQRGMAAKP